MASVDSELPEVSNLDSVEDLCSVIDRCIVQDPGLPRQPIEPDTELLMLGLLDSLTIVKIVATIEKATGTSIPETSLVAANFRTPDAVWSLLREQ